MPVQPVSERAQAIVADPGRFAEFCWRHVTQKKTASAMGVSAETVRAWQIEYGIPTFTRHLPPPYRWETAPKTKEAIRQAAWRAYVSRDRCPMDCNLYITCELNEGGIIGRCPVAFYYASLEEAKKWYNGGDQ